MKLEVLTLAPNLPTPSTTPPAHCLLLTLTSSTLLSQGLCTDWPFFLECCSFPWSHSNLAASSTATHSCPPCNSCSFHPGLFSSQCLFLAVNFLVHLLISALSFLQNKSFMKSGVCLFCLLMILPYFWYLDNAWYTILMNLSPPKRENKATVLHSNSAL